MSSKHRSGMNIKDIIGIVIIGSFLLVCFAGGFFSMGVNNSIAKNFVTIDQEEEPEAILYEPDTEVNPEELAESPFVKAWAYSADDTDSSWTHFVAEVCALKGNTIELKEDGTANAAIGDQEGEYFWRPESETTAVLFDHEGNKHELKLEGDVLHADFISSGFALTEAEEEEE